MKKVKILSLKGRLGKDCNKLLKDVLNINIDNLIFKDSTVKYDIDNYEIVTLKPKYVESFVEIYKPDYILATDVIYRELLDRNNLSILETINYPEIRLSIIGNDINKDSIKTIYANNKNILNEFVKENNINPVINIFDGNLEIFPLLDRNTVILDYIETGRSIKDNNLKELENIDTLKLHLCRIYKE